MTDVLNGATSRDHAFWIARSVARVLGLDLSEALAERRLAPAEYGALVYRCEACALTAGCQRWLARQTDRAAAPIEGCANRAAFEALAR